MSLFQGHYLNDALVKSIPTETKRGCVNSNYQIRGVHHHIISHGWGPKDQNNCRCHPNLSGVAVDALAEDPLDEVDVVAGAVVDEGDPVDARAHPLAHPAAARARAPLAPVERLALGVSRAVHLQRLKRP